MKKSKVIFALTLLVGMPTLMYLLSTMVDKRYTAQVRMQLNPTGLRTEYPNIFQNIDDLATRAKPGNVATQIQVITGTEVLGAAIQQAQDDGILPRGSASSAYEDLARRLQVENDPMSDVVGIRVIQSSPALAAGLANNIANAYAEYTERNRKDITNNLMTALNTQVETMRKKLATIDTRVAALNEKAKVADPTVALPALQNALASNQQSLDGARSQLVGAESELAEAQRILKDMPPTIVTSTQTAANPVAQSQETNLFALRNQLADVQSRFNDDFPDVRSLKQQIKRAEAEYRTTKKNIQSGTNVSPNPAYQQQLATVNAALSNVKKLRSAVASLETSTAATQEKVNQLPQLQREINALMRDRVAMEASYGELERRRDATQAALDSMQPDVKIVSPALPPDAPSFPDPRLFVLAGLAVGGFLAILILMPRQETPAYGDYYPAVYTPPVPPTPAEGAKDPAVEPAKSDSARLEAGSRNDG